jgi:signal transduction histidine kinase
MRDLFLALGGQYGWLLLLLATVAACAAACVSAFYGRSREFRRLRDALDAMSDGLALFDAGDRLLVWNSHYEALRRGLPLRRGLSYIDIVRQGLDSNNFIGLDSDKEAWLAERMKVRRGSGSIDVMNYDGRWLRISERHSSGGGTVTVYSDITDLKRAKEAMTQARDLAQEASRIKSEFLANMSHEIRTPMNGILGMNALMLMSGLSPAQQRYAEVIQSSAEGLMIMFNDILDVARLEAGTVEMKQAEFDLRELLRAVEAEVRPGAEAKGLAFEVGAAVNDGSWPRFVGDAGRLRQVLAHLVGNAVKFTDQGEVRVEVGRRLLDDGRTHVRVDVLDTGPGVPAELKSALFEPFRQADGSTTRKHGGVGLGLAICRHSVQLMGGAVGVMDRPEGGSIFWVELALPHASVRAAAAA